MKAKKDIKNLCKARRDFFIQHLRPSMNEWMLEDYWEWYDELNKAYYSLWKRGIITQEDYQSLLAIAVEYAVDIGFTIKDFEETHNES